MDAINIIVTEMINKYASVTDKPNGQIASRLLCISEVHLFKYGWEVDVVLTATRRYFARINVRKPWLRMGTIQPHRTMSMVEYQEHMSTLPAFLEAYRCHVKKVCSPYVDHDQQQHAIQLAYADKVEAMYSHAQKHEISNRAIGMV